MEKFSWKQTLEAMCRNYGTFCGRWHSNEFWNRTLEQGWLAGWRLRTACEKFQLDPVRPFLTDVLRNMAAPHKRERRDSPIGQGYWIRVRVIETEREADGELALWQAYQ